MEHQAESCLTYLTHSIHNWFLPSSSKMIYCKLYYRILITVTLIIYLSTNAFAYVNNLWSRGGNFRLRNPHQAHKELASQSNRASNPTSGEYDFEKWSQAFQSQLNEFEYDINEIHGSVPTGLRGTLFRSDHLFINLCQSR